VIAAAGLHRLQLFDETFMEYLSEDAFVPAAGQGILVIQTSRKLEQMHRMIQNLNDSNSEQCGRLERNFLSFFQGGCHLPIGALAVMKGKEWRLTAFMGGARSGKVIQASLQNSVPENCAAMLAQQFRQMGADQLLAEATGS
jgi:hydroxymethylbilane synthase